MKQSFESNLIKIPAEEVVDDLYGKPPTKSDKDIAEFRQKNIKKPEKIKIHDIFEDLKDLTDRETKSLKQFFGMDIEVPDLPEEITAERYAEWREMGFELHYLPEMDMTEDKDFPGWKKKPDRLYAFIKTNEVDNSATLLKAGWILIDERAQPVYNEGMQMYENDPLEDAIKQLREKGIIQDYKIKGSRFNLSYDELQKEEVKNYFAEILKVNYKNIRLARAIERNYLRNTYYKKWNDADCSEWLEDKVRGGQHLGGSVEGDLGYAPDDRNADYVGFRPMVCFSEK